MGVKKEFLSDAMIYGIGKGLKKFVSLLLLPFYTRALTVDDYGLLSTLATFSMFLAAILQFGIDSATGYFFFQAESSKEKGKILFTQLVIRIVSVIPAIILSFFSELISKWLFDTTEYTWLVFISIILVPVNMLMDDQTHIFRYHRKPWYYNITTMIKVGVNVIIGVVLVVLLKWGVMGAQLASIISSCAVVIAAFLIYSKNVYTFEFSWYWARKMTKFGFPLIWAGLAGWVYFSSDRFFLLYYKDLTEIGYYSIGTTFSQPIQIINMAVQMSYGVLFFSLFHKEKNPEKPESKHMAKEISNIYFLIVLTLSVAVSLFSPEIIGIVTTSDYIPGAIAVPFLMFSLIAAQAFQTMGPGIEISEKTWHYTWITFATAGLNIILNFLFIPSLGFIGAALATMISFIAYWLVKLYISQKYFPIEYKLTRILIYYFIAFGFAIIIPLEYYRNGSLVPIYLRFIFLSVTLLLPFILGMVRIEDLRNIKKLVKKK